MAELESFPEIFENFEVFCWSMGSDFADFQQI